MARNIVIFCDGTGNEVSGNLTNVLKLYHIAEKSGDQIVFYDPGIGTVGSDRAWHQLRDRLKGVFGLATGAGMDDNILDAYRFLANTYQKGDQIYLFGFSRGAYTVRVLAAFIYMVGLMWPEQLNFADYALTAYKRAKEPNKGGVAAGHNNNFQRAWDFKWAIGARTVPIRFLGVWDTVASIIAPGASDRPWPTLQSLPYTRKNPSIQTVRHAISIDEKRRMFRPMLWKEGENYKDRFATPPVDQPQDCEQRWFAGVHSDVGGGYPESESGAAKISLVWMATEAKAHGLKLDQHLYDWIALGQNPAGTSRPQTAPNPLGELHNSLGLGWWSLEVIRKDVKYREWPKRRALMGWYYPLGEPRLIPDGATIDPSVQTRLASDPTYKPVNLPQP